MSNVIAVLVRLAVLGIALTAYTLIAVPAMSEPGDANIGAGLLAFAALIVVSCIWSLVDGMRQGAPTAIARWAAVAVLLAVGWWVALAVPQDSSMSFGELLAADAASIPFSIGLVLVPAVVGAVVGQAVGRRRG